MPLNTMAQLSGKDEITGTVTDKTGAVIQDSTVAATNIAKGITVKTSRAQTPEAIQQLWDTCKKHRPFRCRCKRKAQFSAKYG